MSQDIRNDVGSLLLRLTVRELFDWRFMQTDPNWGNFLYDEHADQLHLIDFGAAKEYPKPFVDDYLRMVLACADKNRDEVISRSTKLKFLTGEQRRIISVPCAFLQSCGSQPGPDRSSVPRQSVAMLLWLQGSRCGTATGSICCLCICLTVTSTHLTVVFWSAPLYTLQPQSIHVRRPLANSASFVNAEMLNVAQDQNCQCCCMCCKDLNLPDPAEVHCWFSRRR